MTEQKIAANREATTSTKDTVPDVADVLIIGGGPAGLSAATILGRSLRSVILVDDDQPRNAPAAGAHNVLGHDGTPPREILALGRAEAEKYGVRIVSERITEATRAGEHFEATTESGLILSAPRLVLATGLRDVLPEIPGLAEGWGVDVLHCPYCHGWEARGARLAVIGTVAGSVFQALLFANLSDKVSFVCTGYEPTDTEREQLDRAGVHVVTDPADRVSRPNGVGGGIDLDLASGETLEVDYLTVSPRAEARGELFERLGGSLEKNPMGSFIPTDEAGRTPIPGVWAAGNSADMTATVAPAAAEGIAVGAAINAELVMQALSS